MRHAATTFDPRRLIGFLALGLSILGLTPNVVDAQTSDGGLELAIEGPLDGVRGASVSWSLAAYEVRGLTELAPAAGATVHVSTSGSADPLEPLTLDASGRGILTLPIAEDAPEALRVVLRLVGTRGGQRRFELPVNVRAAEALSIVIGRSEVAPGGRLPVLAEVRSRFDGRPIGGAAIRVVLNDEEGRPLGPPVTRESDAAGLVAHRLRVPRDYEGVVVVEASVGEARRRVRAVTQAQVRRPSGPTLLVAVAPDRPLVRPREQVRLDVVVRTSDGVPVAGAAVALAPRLRNERELERAPRTDSRGRATLRYDVPAWTDPIREATVQVEAMKEGLGSGEGATTLRVANVTRFVGFSVEGGALVPELGGRIFVRVVDADGTPTRAGVPVNLRGPSLTADEARTDASGVAVLEARVNPRASGDDACGGGTATSIEIEVEGERPSRGCVALDPDGQLRLRASSSRSERGGEVEVEIARARGVGRAPIAITALASPSGTTAPSRGGWLPIGSVVVPAGRSSASLRLAPEARGVVVLRARPLIGASAQEVRGGSTAIWVDDPAPRALRAESGEGVLRVSAESAEPLHVWAFAAPLDEARAIADRLPFEREGTRLSGGTSDAWLSGAIATGLEVDTAAPAVLRGRDLVPMPTPANAEARGLLRDPWRARARFVDGRLALVLHALEGFVGQSVPGSMEDVAIERRGRFELNHQILDSIAASGQLGPEGATSLGGEPLTIEALRRFDPSLSYDAVARRITRERLFRLLLALRQLVQSSGFDLPWSRLGEPTQWLRQLIGRSVPGGGSIEARDLVDGWGRPFSLVSARGGRSRFRFVDAVSGWELVSAGPDGRLGNGDDLWDPTARVLRSGTPYAEAVGEDVLVARLAGLELGRASLSLLGNTLPEARSRSLPDPRHTQSARTSWDGVPAPMVIDPEPLALRRPSQAAEGAAHLGRLPAGGGELPLPLDVEPRAWGFVVLAQHPSGARASAFTQALGGAPVLVDGEVPDRLHLGETIGVELDLVRLNEDQGAVSIEVLSEGLDVEAASELTLPSGERQPLALQITPTRPGPSSLRIRLIEGGRVVRELVASPSVSRGQHPMRRRAAGLALDSPFRARLAVPESASGATARLVVLAPDALGADPDLEDLRRSDPALIAFSDALAGRPSHPAVRARLLRAQQPNGVVSGALPTLSTACAITAFAAASPEDESLATALGRARMALARLGGGEPEPDAIVRAAAALAALGGGGVVDPSAGRAGGDPLGPWSDQQRAMLRRTLRAHPGEPSLLARAAAGLLIADPHDQYGLAMLARASQALSEEGPLRILSPSEERDSPRERLAGSLALAVAAQQAGQPDLASALMRGVARRDHVVIRGGGEVSFWWLAAAAYGALGRSAETARVVIDGETREITLEGGRALIPIDTDRSRSHEVRVEAPEGTLFARLEAVYDAPFRARDDAPIRLTLEGDVGDADSVGALELTLEVTEALAPIVELQLPVGVVLTDALRATLLSARDVRAVEARRPGFVRIEFSHLERDESRSLPLPLEWGGRGPRRGLGAVAYPRGAPERMQVLPPRALDL